VQQLKSRKEKISKSKNYFDIEQEISKCSEHSWRGKILRGRYPKKLYVIEIRIPKKGMVRTSKKLLD
jgi:hypothetical protein